MGIIHKSIVGGLLLGVAFLGPSCKRKVSSTTTFQGKASDLAEPVKNDRLVLWLQANPQTLNPITASDAYSSSITRSVFDSLLRYDTFTGEPEGLIASSWTISDDGLTYVFKLRENILFHDGAPLTAEDVKFSFDLIKNPKVDAAHLQNYFASLESVTVKDQYTVEFKLKSKYFRHLIMLGLAEILPKHIYSKGNFNTHPNNRNPIGSGPYQFVRWDNGRSIQLKRFNRYWGDQDNHFKNFNNFKEVLYRIILDDRVALMALRKKEIDTLTPTPFMWVNDLTSPEVEKNFYKLKYTTNDGNGYRFIGWNLTHPLFESKSVRQALAYAMPRDLINEKLYKGLLIPSIGPFPKGSDKADPALEPYPYDTKKASTLLAEEGWQDSDKDGLLDKNGKTFTFELIFGSGSPEVERIVLIYQQSLKEIGIDMKIRMLEWTVLLKQIDEKKFDALMMAWGSSLDSDPYQIWHSSQSVPGGSNRVSFHHERVDTILALARETLDREKRNELYREFSRIIADESPYLFLFERPSLLLVDRRIQNVEPLGRLGSDSSRWFVPLGMERIKNLEN